jgi:two-component system sensor histidine kinase KdpD
MNPTRFKAVDLVSSLCDEHQRTFPEYRFAFRATGSPELDADVQLLEMAISNLLTNAAKYSPAGTEISIDLQGDAQNCTIKVSDQGRGIPPNETERIFDRFYRSSNSIGKPGVGLGLHLVRRIAELHGGSVSAHNGENGGAVFILSLKSAPLV